MLLNRRFEEKKLIAVCPGECIPLSKVHDPVFAGGMMGKGIAILPTDGLIVSPIDGTVTVIAETRHAFGITADDGTEVLVHIGIDTVNLKGEGFACFHKVGDHVKAGDPIIQADLKFINSKQIDTVIPILLPNSENLKKFLGRYKGTVQRGDWIIKYLR
jgi:glucose-specific phosphotransferase system IIA component